MKYEAKIEDYYGHIYTYCYEADSYEEAFKKARKDGFGSYSNSDCLSRVEGEYADYSCFDDNERKKKELNYTRIK